MLKETKAKAKVKITFMYFNAATFVFQSADAASKFEKIVLEELKKPPFVYRVHFSEWTLSNLIGINKVDGSRSHSLDGFASVVIPHLVKIGKSFPLCALVPNDFGSRMIKTADKEFFPILVVKDKYGCFMRTNTFFPKGDDQPSSKGHKQSKKGKAHGEKELPLQGTTVIQLSNFDANATVIELTNTEAARSSSFRKVIQVKSPIELAKKFQELSTELVLNLDKYGKITESKLFQAHDWTNVIAEVIQVATEIAEKVVTCASVILYTPTIELNPLQNLYASLVSFLLCPAYRTLKGICALVENEWIQHGAIFYSEYGRDTYYLSSGTEEREHRISDKTIYIALFTIFCESLTQLGTMFSIHTEGAMVAYQFLISSCFSGRYETFTYDGGDFTDFISRRKEHPSALSVLVSHNEWANSCFEADEYTKEPISCFNTITLDLIEKLSTSFNATFWSNVYCESYTSIRIEEYVNALGIKKGELYPYGYAPTKPVNKDSGMLSGRNIQLAFPLPLSCTSTDSDAVEAFLSLPRHSRSADDRVVINLRSSVGGSHGQAKPKKQRKINLSEMGCFYFPPIPTPVATLEDVTDLCLSKNHLLSFPVYLTMIPTLKSFDISYNPIGFISSETIRTLSKRLHNFSELNIKNTRLKYLPDTFKLLPLKWLDLSSNPWTSLANLSGMNKLQTLYIRNCKLQTFPNSITLLPSLTVLDISHNLISKLDRDALGRLGKCLKVLNIASNKLTSSSAKNISVLKELTSLDLSKNELTVFPFRLGFNLQKLSTLDLSGNKDLKYISDSIYLCKNLSKVSINDCPKLKADGLPFAFALKPPKVLECSAEAREELSIKRASELTKIVSRRLEGKDISDFRGRRLAKLVVVGRENVGKTALVRSLVEEKKCKGKPGDILSTEGIDVSKWVVGEGSKKTEVTVCDFAGQAVNYCTYQFFLDSTPLVLLVWSLGFSINECRVSFWLDVISRTSSSAQVIIVATHLDVVPSGPQHGVFAEQIEAFKKQYPKLKITGRKVSSYTFEGIPELRSELVEKIFSVSEELNLEASLIVREVPIALESFMKEPPIFSFDEWTLLAKCCFVAQDSELFAITRQLHRLGIISNFDFPEIKKYVTLQPRYLSELFSSFFTDHNYWIKDGQLLVSSLVQIWKGVDRELHPKMLSIFHLFRLVFLFSAGADDKTSLKEYVDLKKFIGPILDIVKVRSESDVCYLGFYDLGRDETTVLLATDKQFVNKLSIPLIKECVALKCCLFTNDSRTASRAIDGAIRMGFFPIDFEDNTHLVIGVCKYGSTRPSQLYTNILTGKILPVINKNIGHFQSIASIASSLNDQILKKENEKLLKESFANESLAASPQTPMMATATNGDGDNPAVTTAKTMNAMTTTATTNTTTTTATTTTTTTATTTTTDPLNTSLGEMSSENLSSASIAETRTEQTATAATMVDADLSVDILPTNKANEQRKQRSLPRTTKCVPELAEEGLGPNGEERLKDKPVDFSDVESDASEERDSSVAEMQGGVSNGKHRSVRRSSSSDDESFSVAHKKEKGGKRTTKFPMRESAKGSVSDKPRVTIGIESPQLVSPPFSPEAVSRFQLQTNAAAADDSSIDIASSNAVSIDRDIDSLVHTEAMSVCTIPSPEGVCDATEPGNRNGSLCCQLSVDNSDAKDFSKSDASSMTNCSSYKQSVSRHSKTHSSVSDFDIDHSENHVPSVTQSNPSSEKGSINCDQEQERDQDHFVSDTDFGYNQNDIIFIPCKLPEKAPDIDEHLGGIKAEELLTEKLYRFSTIPEGLFGSIIVTIAKKFSMISCWRNGIVFNDPASGVTSKILLYADLIESTISLLIRFSTAKENALTIVASLIESLEGYYFPLFTHMFSLHWETFYACNACLPSKGATVFSSSVIASALRSGATLVCPHHKDPIITARLAPDLVVFDIIKKFKGMEIQQNSVTTLKRIGIGSSAIVYKGYWLKRVHDSNGVEKGEADPEDEDLDDFELVTENGEAFKKITVAVKKFKAGRTGGEDAQIDISEKLIQCRREIELLSSFKHPNLLRFYGFTIDPLSIILELVEDGRTLYDLVGEHCTLPLDERLEIAKDICSGMLFLHSRSPPILHRDLKSPNVLMKLASGGKRMYRAILCDFGESGEVNTQIREEIENPIWLAPEVITNERYTLKSDVYAFGVILWELNEPKRFFQDLFMNEISRSIVDGKRPKIHTRLTSYCRLIQSCWDQSMFVFFV